MLALVAAHASRHVLNVELLLQGLTAPQLTTGAELDCSCPIVASTYHGAGLTEYHAEPSPHCLLHGHLFRASVLEPCNCPYRVLYGPAPGVPNDLSAWHRAFVINASCWHHGLYPGAFL